jgi:CsoR family transcriptional regulator, copper-sensing transcriptional repressor
MNARHKRDVLLRLKTVRGHLDGVIRMVEAEAYCPELMKQIAAAQASLERVNRILLQNHLETCVTEAIQAGGGSAKIAELIDALRFNGSLTDFRERADPLATEPPDMVQRDQENCCAGPRPKSAGRSR